MSDSSSTEITGSAPWDGKDMAVIQMLVCDLREQGRPVAEWRDGQLYVRARPGMKTYIPTPVGFIIERNGLELSGHRA